MAANIRVLLCFKGITYSSRKQPASRFVWYFLPLLSEALECLAAGFLQNRKLAFKPKNEYFLFEMKKIMLSVL